MDRKRSIWSLRNCISLFWFCSCTLNSNSNNKATTLPCGTGETIRESKQLLFKDAAEKPYNCFLIIQNLIIWQKEPGTCGLQFYDLYTIENPRQLTITVTKCVDRLLKVLYLGCLGVWEVSKLVMKSVSKCLNLEQKTESINDTMIESWAWWFMSIIPALGP